MHLLPEFSTAGPWSVNDRACFFLLYKQTKCNTAGSGANFAGAQQTTPQRSETLKSTLSELGVHITKWATIFRQEILAGIPLQNMFERLIRSCCVTYAWKWAVWMRDAPVSFCQVHFLQIISKVILISVSLHKASVCFRL